MNGKGEEREWRLREGTERSMRQSRIQQLHKRHDEFLPFPVCNMGKEEMEERGWNGTIGKEELVKQ